MATQMISARVEVPKTKSRKYTDVPVVALATIKKAVPLHGSQGRILQVATEILIRQKRPIKITYKTRKNGKSTTASFKLLPRTIKLIDKLAPLYGGRGQVLMASAQIIKDAV
jgi:hypothetical protein